MKYKISHWASQDLENIWFYTFENWSKEQADSYLNLLLDKIEHLAENPETGFDFSSVRKGYFKVRVKSHIIFYKIENESKSIEIIRVLHQRMDIESKLGE